MKKQNQTQERKRNEGWKTHWQSRPTKGAIYSSQGTLRQMPGFYYSVVCSKVPALSPVEKSAAQLSHIYWITYYRIKAWPMGTSRTPTQCLFSEGLPLKNRRDADGIAWLLMLRLQHQLTHCLQPYFLAHSGSRINQSDIYEYWSDNARRSLADIMGNRQDGPMG
jgi:hypothetical protein